MGAAIVAAVWLSAAADAGTTHYALTHGLREANPIVRSLGVEQHPWRLYPFKALAAGAVIATTAKLPKRQKYALRGFTAVVWTAVSVWNWQQIRQHGRR